nr:unnamed protein product [Callosobruchus chinensis]
MDTKQMSTNKNEAFLPTSGTDREAAARPSLPPRVPPRAGRYDRSGAHPKCAIVDVVVPPSYQTIDAGFVKLPSSPDSAIAGLRPDNAFDMTTEPDYRTYGELIKFYIHRLFYSLLCA